MKPFKTYDAATELAIEERIKALTEGYLHGRKDRADFVYLQVGPLGAVIVEQQSDGVVLAHSFVRGGDSSVQNATSLGHGEAGAIGQTRRDLARMRASLTKANRRLRGTTTKELKAEVAEQEAF